MPPTSHEPVPRGSAQTGAAPSDLRADDDELLDWYFAEATEAMQDGRDFAATEVLAGREYLAPHLERLADLARFVAARPQDRPPHIRGYTILSELGRGGMAAVYLARQESLGGRTVALKVLPHLSARSPSARDRFRSEVLAVAKQKHPGIVQVYDVIDDGSTLAYAMEWVDGSSLDELVRHVYQKLRAAPSDARADRHALDLSNAFADVVGSRRVEDPSFTTFVARVGLAAAEALDAVHSSGLLHRDVKPSNILLRRDGAVLLSDFGLARELTSADATIGDSFIGTAPYASPEQLRGRRDLLDARSDVYSLGATLYHSLTLRPPYASRSAVEVLTAIDAEGPLPLRRLCPAAPEDLCTIIAKAMDPDPARRYQTAAAMAQDLQRLLEDRPILARPAGLTRRLRKFFRRNRVLLLTGVLVAVIVGAGAGAIVMRQFYYPRWAQQSLDDARTTLLTRTHGFAMYNHSFFGVTTPSVWPTSTERLRAAAEHYDQALRFGSHLTAARVERDVLLAIVQHSPQVTTTEGDPFPLRYPRTTEFLAAVARTPDKPPPRRSDEADKVFAGAEFADSDDLRALGLAALILLDTGTAVEAWRELERRMDDDPFIAAALGMLYVCDERYPIAYPRLRDAVRAYPESGILNQFAAEAAWGCGDTIKARQYLEAGRLLPEQDDRADYRLRILLRITEEGLEPAVGQYWTDMVELPTRKVADNSILRYQLGREAERRGEIEIAANLYATAIGGDNWIARRPSRALQPVAARWWGSLDEDGKRAALSLTFDGAPWWARNGAGVPYVPYNDARRWWPVPLAAQDAQAAEQLEAVASRMYEDCGADVSKLPRGRDDADRRAILNWWMTGKDRPVTLDQRP